MESYRAWAEKSAALAIVQLGQEAGLGLGGDFQPAFLRYSLISSLAFIGMETISS